jgi:hypothetical protein
VLAGIGAAVLVAPVLLWLFFRSPRSPTAYVADLPILAVGPGDFSKDGQVRLSSTDVRRLSVDGKLTPKGLFMFPPDSNTTFARFRLAKQYSRLETAVSISDTSNGCPGVICTVSGDGRKLWESTSIMSRAGRQECAVDISGIDVLELAATCPGQRIGPTSTWGAHVVWIDPLVKR